MAEHFHESFGAFGNSTLAVVGPKWDEWSNGGVGTVPTAGARFTSAPYISFSQNSGYLGRPLLSNQSHLFIGFALTRNSNPSTSPAILFNLVDGSTLQCYVAVAMTGDRLEFRRGDTTLLFTTAAGTVATVGTAWDYYEFEVVIHNTTGSITIWRNNTQIGTASSLNTRMTANNYANRFRLNYFGNNGNCVMSYSDLYVIDDQSGSGPNSRVGDSRMYYLAPTGAGSSTDFTPSTGSNWQNVDDVPANGDTDYNSSATVGNKDRYAMADLPGTFAGTVLSVTHGYVARKDDAGVRSVAGNIRSGSSETAGVTNALSTSYQHYADTIWTDPNGGGALSATVVNALQAGPDVIA
jgi:hypothetical protein